VSRLPKLRIVEAVTREHGERFADDWRDRSMAMYEAFEASGVVKWPNSRPAQGRYHDIEDEITERVFDELRDAVIETFVRVAGEVLTRERRHP
jgi:hypothetical protein